MSSGVDRGLTGRQPQAVQSALAILEEVARAGAGVTAKEVAAGLGLPPATTYRLLNLLVGEEYLVRLPDLHGFALGRKVAGLTGAAGQLRVPTAAREVVAELRQHVRFGVHLILYTSSALYCADVDPDHPLSSPELIARHLHASAVGKLLLAEQPEWEDVMPSGRLRQLTRRTVKNASALGAELCAVRKKRVAVQSGQLHDGISCLAVPVRSPSGVLVGAIAVSIPGPDVAESLTGVVEEFTRKLSPLLG